MKTLISVLLASLCLVGTAAQADTYPSKPIRLVVGYGPGGTADIVGRLIGNEMARINKQAVVIDNRVGAGGVLGLNAVATAPADGYVLGVAVSGTLVTGPHVQRSMPYDPLTAFAPISMLVKAPLVMLAAPSMPETSIQAIVERAKKSPGELMYASGALAYEAAMLLFNAQTGAGLTVVSYPSLGQAATDVMTGRVPLLIDTIGTQLPNIQAGKLRPVAVLDSQRATVLPDVPTMRESGVAGYEAFGWVGLVAPRGTPADVVAKLNSQMKTIMAVPEVKEKLIQLGFEINTSSAEAFDKSIQSEYAKWGAVFKAAGIRPQ